MTDVTHYMTGHAAAATGADMRTSPRQRMLKSGKIAYSSRQVTLECVVRDLSSTGAKLKVLGSVEPPATFELIIELDGIIVDCEVMWRAPPMIGVQFTSEIRRGAPGRIQSVSSSAAKPRPSLLRKPIGNLR